MHSHRSTTRRVRWHVSLAVVAIGALAVAVGAAVGSPAKRQATTLTDAGESVSGAGLSLVASR